MADIIIYTDGSCLRNPGPGGYAALLRCNGLEREISGGFAHTTNNRMELMAVIKALEALGTMKAKDATTVTIYSDSQYVVHAINQRWLPAWQRKNFKKTKNKDLWLRYLDVQEGLLVRFSWIRGHTGEKENERCDQLAREAARCEALPVDVGYEKFVI